MIGALRQADGLLRGGLRDAPELSRTRATGILVSVLLFGTFYGAVMGTSSGVAGDRLLQVVYSGAKVPLLLLVTFVVSLPSFFVLNTLLGVRDDFGIVLRALLATQGVLTVVLASFAPVTLLWYLSSANYQAAIVFNAMIFGLASVSAQIVLRRLYEPLIRANPTHRRLLRLWIVVYAFVGIQMAWVLRPFIGNPGRPVEFFREGAWGNAYVEFVNIARSAVGL